MARKIVNKGSVGAADEFATDDIDYINKLLTGVDQSSTDPVPMNTTWTFGHGKAKIRNSGDTASTTVNTATTTNNTITLPNETGTVLTSATANVVKNDQNNDLGDFYLDFGDIAVPSNPASGKVRIFFNTATGELSVRKAGGTTVSLESGGGGGSWDPTAAETLTNKTIAFANNTLTNVASTTTAQNITGVKTFDSSAVIMKGGTGAFGMTFVIPTLASDKTLTFPLFSSSDTLVARTTTDTLSNKTIDASTNTIRAHDQTFKLRSTGTGNPDYTIANPAGTTARTLTIPTLGQNDTFAFLAEAQTITGVKTFSAAPVISTISNSGTVTIPTGTDTLVNLAGTQTLSGKTLTTPTIATIKPDASHALNLPAVDDTLATLTSAQTFTTKTIAFGSNTLTDVASTNTAQTFVTAAKTFNSGLIKVRNPGDTFSYTVKGDAIGSNYDLTLPLQTANDTIAALGVDQTFTGINKFSSANLRVKASTNNAFYKLTGSNITADRAVTYPLLAGDDTFVMEAFGQTLTNKTISGASNTISNIPKSAIPAATLYNDVDNVIGSHYAELTEIATPSNPASSDKIRIYMNSATHRFSSLKSDGTINTLWNPAEAETLTNKTISASSNTLTGVATLTGTETLTNKTLTSPTVNSPTLTNSGNTLTLPTTTDTIVGRATSDTLTNKTIDAKLQTATNNFMVLPNVRRWGGWLGGASTNAQGFLVGGLPTATGAGTAVVDSTLGKYKPFVSGAVAGNNAGHKSSASADFLVMRALNARFIGKFFLTTADTNTRCFVGLQNISSTTFPAGDSQLDSVSGIGLAFRTTDTVWQIVHNDGTAGSTIYDNVTGSPTRDTGVHTIEIKADNANSQWVVTLDGGTAQNITTRIPASNTAMSACVMVETATTAARTINMFWWYVESDL